MAAGWHRSPDAVEAFDPIDSQLEEWQHFVGDSDELPMVEESSEESEIISKVSH